MNRGIGGGADTPSHMLALSLKAYLILLSYFNYVLTFKNI